MSPTISVIKRKCSRGFSLVEALVATAFIGVISIAVITAQAGHTHMVDTSRKRTIATQLAEEAMESAIAMRFDDLAALDLREEGYGEIPNFPDFRRTMDVTIDPTNSDLVEVTVTVFWRTAEIAENPVVLGMAVTHKPETAT